LGSGLSSTGNRAFGCPRLLAGGPYSTSRLDRPCETPSQASSRLRSFSNFPRPRLAGRPAGPMSAPARDCLIPRPLAAGVLSAPGQSLGLCEREMVGGLNVEAAGSRRWVSNVKLRNARSSRRSSASTCLLLIRHCERDLSSRVTTQIGNYAVASIAVRMLSECEHISSLVSSPLEQFFYAFQCRRPRPRRSPRLR